MTTKELIEKLQTMPQDAELQNPYWDFPCKATKIYYVPAEDLYDEEKEKFPKGAIRLL